MKLAAVTPIRLPKDLPEGTQVLVSITMAPGQQGVDLHPEFRVPDKGTIYVVYWDTDVKEWWVDLAPGKCPYNVWRETS